jgi:aromatic-L-amino-acid decarboxylase
VYASEEAHSSIERACITLGLGAESLVRIPIDAEYRLRVDALRDAIAADRAAGRRPIAVVAALGTTSSTSIDPIGAIADVAAADDLWLHVDAAYAGSAAIVPELRPLFDGWERADSIVVNPHKWLFVPLDASLLLTRRMDTLRAAFSLVPEHLLRSADARPVRNYNEYTPALGRRFRALKLWVHLRWFGLEGLRTAIREHVALAGELASWVAADPDWELLAPTPFSTVCFRYQPARSDGARLDPAELDRLNEAILAEVNAAGDVWLSPTRLHDRFTIRVAVGNLRTERRHVVRAWERLREAAARVGAPAEAGAR